MRDACCSVLELRQYTLHPGTRDRLIELFDRALVEGQEATGMHVVDYFRDLDRPERFAFVRGFRNMAARAAAMSEFYDGPVWKAHRDAANATMIDWSDVRLLRPVASGSGFSHAGLEAPAPLVVASVFVPSSEEEFARFFEERGRPLAGGTPLAWLRTEPAENNFPRLPIRTDENVFIWFAAFADDASARAHIERLDGSVALRSRLDAPPAHVRLAPASGSRRR